MIREERILTDFRLKIAVLNTCGIASYKGLKLKGKIRARNKISITHHTWADVKAVGVDEKPERGHKNTVLSELISDSKYSSSVGG